LTNQTESAYRTTILTIPKLITASLIAVYFLPCLAFGYHMLNHRNSSGNFVFLKWSNTPVNLRLDPGTLGGGDGKEIVQQACDTWNNVPTADRLCGNFSTLSEDITVENYESVISDKVSDIDVIFDETGEILADMGFSPTSTLGVSSVTSNGTNGEIQNVLLVLNGSLQSTLASDLLSTTIHEMGHGWGLAHIPIGGINSVNVTPGLEPIDPEAIPTMYPFNIPTNDTFGRTLELDDKIGISVRYPSN
jgi:hypothetical protein